MGVERQVDQAVIIKVDDAVVVEIAVEPVGAAVVDAGVGARVVIEVYDAVQIRVAIPRVFHEHG